VARSSGSVAGAGGALPFKRIESEWVDMANV
jgi:hypothetical protein